MNTAPDGRNESLEELFGSVFSLAGAFAGQIGEDGVEARLRRVLRQAGHPAQAPDPGLPLVVTLVCQAAGGDQGAWDQLVERYAPLVHATCQLYRLSDRDAGDVGQRVWAQLADQLGMLREPAALAGWLATTTARECRRVRGQRSDPLAGWQEDPAWAAEDEAIGTEILTAERDAVLRAAMAALPSRCQQLLAMLMHDPPYSYPEISAALGIPVGSIGPQRARCLDRLRQSVTPGLRDNRMLPDSGFMNDRPRPKPRPAP